MEVLKKNFGPAYVILELIYFGSEVELDHPEELHQPFYSFLKSV